MHRKRRTGFNPCHYLIALGVIFSLLTGCGTVPTITVAPPARPKKIALVLGGGGARGFAHIGVIRELEKAGIPIDLIVGVSVGSLIGALYADKADSFDLEWKAFKIEKNEIFDFKLVAMTDSLAKGDALMKYIDTNIGTKLLENLKIPLAVVAVDLNTGSRVVFTRGPIRETVRASASVPGVFKPVLYQGKTLVDGGVMGNLAPEVAKELGADIIIGVDLAKQRKPLASDSLNMVNVILESIEIMGDEIVKCKSREIDFLIRPNVGDVSLTDFSQKKALMEAGRQAALLVIPKIKAALEKPSELAAIPNH